MGIENSILFKDKSKVNVGAFGMLTGATTPLDLRLVVDHVSDLFYLSGEADADNGGAVYEGMMVWVRDENGVYVYTGQSEPAEANVDLSKRFLLRYPYNPSRPFEGDNSTNETIVTTKWRKYMVDTTNLAISTLEQARLIQGYPFNGTQDVSSGKFFPESFIVPDGSTILETAKQIRQSGFHYTQLTATETDGCTHRYSAGLTLTKIKGTNTEKAEGEGCLYHREIIILEEKICITTTTDETKGNVETTETIEETRLITRSMNDGVDTDWQQSGLSATPDREGVISLSDDFKTTNQDYGLIKRSTDFKADNTNYGLVQLCDDINQPSYDKDSGFAATPKAVALVNQAVSAAIQASANGADSALAAEAAARQSADTALGTRISDEAAARQSADTALGTRISNETTARQSADTALGTRISDEATARQSADGALGDLIRQFKDNLQIQLGYRPDNIYRATCADMSQAGNVPLSWDNAPTTLYINDVVIIYFTIAQRQQMNEKYITLNGKAYEVNWGDEVNQYTTKYFVCDTEPNGNTKGSLTAFSSVRTRISNIETKISQKLDKIPIGMIVMWSGTTIPTGWKLCNGENGTPDLRDRFIVGSGNTYTIGNTGGSKTQTASKTITATDLPTHRHIVIADVNITKASTSSPTGFEAVDTSESVSRWSADGSGTGRRYYSGSNVYNPANGSYNSNSSKTLTSDSFDNRPPYYALAFIMFKG